MFAILLCPLVFKFVNKNLQTFKSLYFQVFLNDHDNYFIKCSEKCMLYE